MSWTARRTTLTQETRCDSCTTLIPAGVRARRIPIKTVPKGRTKQEAIRASRGEGPPRFTYRCIGCPIPELSIQCPTCDRFPGMPCALPVRDSLGKVFDYGRDMKRPHRARTRRVKTRNESFA